MLGVIVLVMSLASAVGTLAAQGLDPAVLAGKVIGVLIPALYTYGGLAEQAGRGLNRRFPGLYGREATDGSGEEGRRWGPGWADM